MDEEFHNSIDELFESKLFRNFIRIQDLDKGIILSESDMNYDKVMFDADLNIYKFVDGVLTPVGNDNFKALLI